MWNVGYDPSVEAIGGPAFVDDLAGSQRGPTPGCWARRGPLRRHPQLRENCRHQHHGWGRARLLLASRP
eukprot:6891908-Lingulodinium_polyedra.AAC.1